MCLIFVSENPQSWAITNDRLNRAMTCNPHGCGLAFWDRLKWKTVLNPSTEQIQAIARAAPVIVHYRFATHGEKTASNTQPFILSDSHVFAHNGVVSGTLSGNKNTDSDSKRIARILQQTNKDCWGEILNMLASGHASRFVLGGPAGKARVFGCGWGPDNASPSVMCSDGGREWTPIYYDPRRHDPDAVDTPTDISRSFHGYCEACGKMRTVKWNEEFQLDLCKDCVEFYSRAGT